MEPADQAAQFLAVFLFHVDELDAAARGLDVSHHRSRVNATQAGADFYTDGLAHGEPSVRLQKRSAQAKRSEEHTSELQSLAYLVCRLLLEKKKKKMYKEVIVQEHTDWISVSAQYMQH